MYLLEGSSLNFFFETGDMTGVLVNSVSYIRCLYSKKERLIPLYKGLKGKAAVSANYLIL